MRRKWDSHFTRFKAKLGKVYILFREESVSFAFAVITKIFVAIYFSVFYGSVVSRFLLKRPVALLPSFFLFYMVCWSFLKSTNLNWFSVTHLSFGLLGFEAGVSTDLAIIKTITGLISFALPLSIPFFYFSYREQKSLAISSASFWNNSTLYFGFFAITAIAFGTHLRIALSTALKSSGPHEIYSGVYLLWVILVFSAFVQGYKAIRLHISNMHMASQIGFAIKQVNDTLFSLNFTVTEKQRKAYYEKIRTNTDAVYQLLYLAIEKNTFTFYSTGIEKWNKVLSELHFHPFPRKVFSISISLDDGLYQSLYKLILRNQINLIVKLIDSHRMEDAFQALEIFGQLENRRPEYYTAFQELAILCYKKDILDNILILMNKTLAADRLLVESVNGINLIYKQLVLIAVEKNDLKTLSRIVYSMMDNMEFEEEEKVKMIGRIPVPILSISSDQKNQLNECVMYIFMQATLKSIELSYYSITGFMIKFIITNFNGDFVKKVYAIAIENFIKKHNMKNPYLADTRITNISIGFNFNKTTLRYCFEKMSLLIYFQQRFVLHRKIKFGVEVEPVINLSNIISYDIEYLTEKLKKSGDKYGLLYFSDEEFMKLVISRLIKILSKKDS